MTSVMFVGDNSRTNKTSRLALTLKSNPSSPFPSISKHAKQDPFLSSSRTGTSLYINGLCVTAIATVTNLQLLRNTNFISVRNSYISLLKSIV